MAIDDSGNWSYYKQIDISDTGNVSADYQMKLTVYSGSGDDSTADGIIYCDNNCESFPDDIRFGTTNDPSTATQLSQWIETSDATSATIWVKLPSDGSNTFYMFVGNSGASQYSDGDDTFIFFDGAEDGVVGWTKGGSDGSLTQSTVEVKRGSYSFYSHLGSVTSYYKEVNAPDNCVLEYDIYFKDWNNDGARLQTQLTDSNDWYGMAPRYFPNGSYIKAADGNDHVFKDDFNTEQWYKISITTSRSTGKYEYYVNNSLQYSDATYADTPSSFKYFRLGNYRGYSYYLNTYIDDIRIRKYASTEPTWSSFGSWTSIGGGNNAPTVSNGYPSDGATDVELQPICHIDVSDPDGNTMNISWYENTTGSWVLRQTNSSVSNGTYYWTYTQASDCSTTYYWKVEVDDGTDTTTEVYHFTTKEIVGEGWQWVRQLDISNTTADYQIKLRLYKNDPSKDDPSNGTIDLAGHCENFPNDIRFGTTNDPSTADVLQQWIESKLSDYVDIWVKLPSSNPDTIYLFVGNENASGYSDGDDTFLFFDDFSYLSVYNSSKWDKIGSGDVEKVITEQFTASHGGQGLATDGTYFYFGHNNGTGVDGTIYKIQMSNGNEVASFTGPPHCAGGDWREDYDTLLFSSGGSETPEVWEINASTGTKIRSWDFTGEGYNRGALVAYKSENRIYLFTSDTSSNFKIKEYQINDDGTWSGIGTEYSHSSLGTPQGLDYVDGHLYYLYDHGISKLQLNADGTITILETLNLDSSTEKEGLAYWDGHWYYGQQDLKIYKILHKLKIHIKPYSTSLYSKNTYSTNTAIRAEWERIETSYPGFGYGNKSSSVPDIVDDSYGGHGITIGKIHRSNDYVQGRQTDDASNRVETSSLGAGTSYKIYEIRRKSSSAVYINIDDNISAELSSHYPTENLYVGVGGHYDSGASADGYSVIDWIVVRKYTSPEPSWSSFGSWTSIGGGEEETIERALDSDQSYGNEIYLISSNFNNELYIPTINV